jgi:hypothetical protein
MDVQVVSYLKLVGAVSKWIARHIRDNRKRLSAAERAEGNGVDGERDRGERSGKSVKASGLILEVPVGDVDLALRVRTTRPDRRLEDCSS